MTAGTSVDQQLIAKNSFVIQKEECQRKMKYQCKQCDFETTSSGSLIYQQKSIHMGIK